MSLNCFHPIFIPHFVQHTTTSLQALLSSISIFIIVIQRIYINLRCFCKVLTTIICRHRHLLISCNTQQHRYKLFLLQFQYSLLLFNVFTSIHIVFVIVPTIVRCSAKLTIPHSLNTQQHHYSVLFHKFQLSSLLFNVFMSIGFNFIIVFEQLSVVVSQLHFVQHSTTSLQALFSSISIFVIVILHIYINLCCFYNCFPTIIDRRQKHTTLLSSIYFFSFQSTTLASMLLIFTFKSIQYIISFVKICFLFTSCAFHRCVDKISNIANVSPVDSFTKLIYTL
jgi:hypothetical protein